MQKQQAQLRTIHQTRKRLRKRTGFGSRNANARNAENETIIEKAHLSINLDYNMQGYMLDIF
jgi:hypothetical protein